MRDTFTLRWLGLACATLTLGATLTLISCKGPSSVSNPEAAPGERSATPYAEPTVISPQSPDGARSPQDAEEETRIRREAAQRLTQRPTPETPRTHPSSTDRAQPDETNESLFGGATSRGPASSAIARPAPDGASPPTDALEPNGRDIDEVIVIVKDDDAEPAGRPRPDQRHGRRAPPAAPGCGALVVERPGETAFVPVPLEHTSVEGDIAGVFASVSVRQTYRNLFTDKIEAVYMFPLPSDAAVNDFVMQIGERRIRGVIREKEEAERIYETARSQGKVASLLSQRRPNVFKQRVANIEPGKKIDIEITYFHAVDYAEGWHEWTFPMVIGPRFNPPGASDPILATPRGAQDPSFGSGQVQCLRPDERSGHDIDLSVDLRFGVEIDAIESRSHVIEGDQIATNTHRVTLSPNDRIPNKDFVLRWRIADDEIEPALLVSKDGRGGGHFALTLYPPDELEATHRQPLEMVFVLDCSGSMNGRPIELTKAAVRRALRRLDHRDTFQIIRFSDSASTFGSAPIAATPDNVRRGLDFIDALSAGGGTMMINGIRQSLDFPHDPKRLRVVAFMTDGYIGNEAQILGEIHQRLERARIFSFGIGSSPNRYLLDRMAKMGRGAVAYVGLNDPAADIMDAFVKRASKAAMTGVSIGLRGAEIDRMSPPAAPDLFLGRPVVITGRFTGRAPSKAVVTGRVRGRPVEMRIDIEQDQSIGSARTLATAWARATISDLVDRAAWDPDRTIPTRIRDLALAHNLVSNETSFVAVDSLSQAAGSSGVTVGVAVPTPEGARYETTVAPRR